MFCHAPSSLLRSGASPLWHLFLPMMAFVRTGVFFKLDHSPCTLTPLAVKVCQLRLHVWLKVVSLYLFNCPLPGIHGGGALFQGQAHQLLVILVTRDHDTHRGLPYLCVGAFLHGHGTIIFRLRIGVGIMLQCQDLL